MKMIRTMLVAFVLVKTAMSVSTARADHDEIYARISSHAEMIVSASRDLNNELRFRFHDSRRYGDLLATNARIRSKANYVRSLARSSRREATLHRFLAELDEQVCRLESLVAEAKHRAARGDDPRLGNTRVADAYIAEIHEAIHCIQRDLSLRSAPQIAVPREQYAPGYSGDWGYEGGRGFDRGYNPGYGSGFGSSSGRGIRLDRDSITLSTGGLSVHFDR